MSEMLILLNTSTSNEHGYTADYDYAVLKLDEHDAKLIAGCMASFEVAKKSQPALLEAIFDLEDVKPEWYSCDVWNTEEPDDVPEELRESLDDKGYAIIPSSMELPFTPKDAHEPDGLYLHVSESGFWWRALPNDSDITIDCQEIPKEILTQLI